jgi:hypothetical protein
MIRPSGLESFVERAFAKASSLCNAQFGPLAARILADDRARPQGFEHALLPTDRPPDISFALVTGDDPAFRAFVPDLADEIHVLSTPDLYAYWRPAPERGFFVFDRRSRRGVTWFPDDSAPAWAIGQPCSPLLPAATEGTDWCMAHAAAVGREGRFLLLLGPGKAGKSTVTLACIRAGWDYAGDDFVLVNPVRGLVAPLYSSIRLRQTGAAAFRSLADTAFMVSEDEGAARYELRLPVAPTGGEVVAVLGLRRRGASEVTFEPARPMDYLGPLLRDSVARAPGSAAGMTPKLLAVGHMAPAFSVDTGSDPAAIPAGLDRFLGSDQWQRRRTA